jgi:hypothetical protein
VQSRDEWGRRVLGGDLFTIELEKNNSFHIWDLKVEMQKQPNKEFQTWISLIR